MTEREQHKLHDQVKTCRTEMEYVYADHTWVNVTEDDFTLDGQLVSKHHRNADGSTWEVVCSFDTDGRLVEKKYSGGLRIACTRTHMIQRGVWSAWISV